MLRQAVPVVGCVADSEPRPGALVEPALQQEGAGRLRVGRRELFDVELRRRGVRLDELLPLAGLLAGGGPALLVGDLDAGLAGQYLDRLDERQVLPLLHERDEVAADAAAEALVEPVGRVDVERRRLLVVERAETLVA